MWVAFEIAEELDLVTSVRDCRGVVVCAQMDDFLSAVIAEGCVKEEGAVDALVGCSVDWGEVRGGEGVTGRGLDPCRLLLGKRICGHRSLELHRCGRLFGYRK